MEDEGRYRPGVEKRRAGDGGPEPPRAGVRGTHVVPRGVGGCAALSSS